MLQDGHTAEGVSGHNIAGGGAGLGQLLGDDGGGKLIRPLTTVLLGHNHAHDAQLEQLSNILRGIGVVPVNLRRNGLHLIFGETADHLLNERLLFCQCKIHGIPLHLLFVFVANTCDMRSHFLLAFQIREFGVHYLLRLG